MLTTLTRQLFIYTGRYSFDVSTKSRRYTKIVAIDDLIAITEKSNRKQDREDIKALRKLR